MGSVRMDDLTRHLLVTSHVSHQSLLHKQSHNNNVNLNTLAFTSSNFKTGDPIGNTLSSQNESFPIRGNPGPRVASNP